MHPSTWGLVRELAGTFGWNHQLWGLDPKGGGGFEWSTRSGRSQSLTPELHTTRFYGLVLHATPYNTYSIVRHCIAGYTSVTLLAY